MNVSFFKTNFQFQFITKIGKLVLTVIDINFKAKTCITNVITVYKDFSNALRVMFVAPCVYLFASKY